MLPEALDLMTVVIQAGLDFQVALARYLEFSAGGALREEFAKVQRALQTGSSRADALRALAAGASCPELRQTAKAVLQAMELGSGLTPILRAQSRLLRKKRALAAEKTAALAPLKLLFPLFVFIFPTIFVVLFGPVVLAVMKGSTG